MQNYEGQHLSLKNMDYGLQSSLCLCFDFNKDYAIITSQTYLVYDWELYGNDWE